MSVESCDVAVIGGGPAGSTVAALLARSGHRVIVLEKAHHPRFHIGESLLPMNLPLFERLGVLEQVRALGVRKCGADFEADNERGYNTFAFARALGNSPPHAFQVWRADFDRMLFEHARGCGANARATRTSRCAPMMAAVMSSRRAICWTRAGGIPFSRRAAGCAVATSCTRVR